MRNRIVINLDAAEGKTAKGSQSARGKKRWPRVLAILTGIVLVIVVVAAAGGFFWWRRYQSTPSYTLALIVDAAQRNDVAEFQKRIDDQEIAKNMIASVSQKAAGRYGFALNSSVQQQIDNALPSLLPRLQQTIHDEVAKEIKAFASKSEPKPFVFLLLAIPSLMTVTTEGETAKATTAVSDRPVELTMRRDADRWKVTDFKDDVVVQRVVDSVMKELPPLGSIDSSNPLLKKSTRRKSAGRQR